MSCLLEYVHLTSLGISCKAQKHRCYRTQCWPWNLALGITVTLDDIFGVHKWAILTLDQIHVAHDNLRSIALFKGYWADIIWTSLCVWKETCHLDNKSIWLYWMVSKNRQWQPRSPSRIDGINSSVGIVLAFTVFLKDSDGSEKWLIMQSLWTRV